MKIKKGNFIAVDFTASVKDGAIFDTTIEEEAKKAKLFDENKKEKQEFKPFLICVGEKMVIKGFDDSLVDKEVAKEYEIELTPKDAFGKRNPKLIKTIPLSAFKETPHPGMFVNVNGLIAKVITITSGRILIDLNNPLAGKIVIYKFKINKIIEDNSEKIKIIAELFNLQIDSIKVENKKAKIKFKNFKIKESDKIKEKIELVEKFKAKIKELIGFECEFD